MSETALSSYCSDNMSSRSHTLSHGFILLPIYIYIYNLAKKHGVGVHLKGYYWLIGLPFSKT